MHAEVVERLKSAVSVALKNSNSFEEFTWGRKLLKK